MTAISNYAESLSFVSEELSDDKEIVLLAVSNNGLSLQFASENLKNDKECLLLLEKNNQRAIGEYPGWYKERMKMLSLLR
jgi:hypothetical protein